MDAALSRRVPKERTHEAPPRGELGQALEEAGEVWGRDPWVGRVGGWGVGVVQILQWFVG